MAAIGRAPVIFINGLIGTLKCQRIEQALSGRPCAAPDLLGYGCLAHAAVDNIDIPSQVEYLEHWIRQWCGRRKVHLVGHSVGGVVACLFALRHPQRVQSLVSVEGTFSLKDAFWSKSLARASAHEVEAILAGYQAQPWIWLARSGLDATPELLNRAVQWLGHQPASTLQAMAQSVVAVTGSPDYPQQLQSLFQKIPVRLLAGEQSLVGWDVPRWAREMAGGVTVMPGCGHLMMLEDPTGFAQRVAAILARLEA